MRLAELGGYTSPTKNMTESKGGVKPIPEAALAKSHAPIELGGCPVASIHRAAERNCLINSWKAPRLWFGDTRDALIGPLDLVLAAHETPE